MVPAGRPAAGDLNQVPPRGASPPGFGPRLSAVRGRIPPTPRYRGGRADADRHGNLAGARGRRTAFSELARRGHTPVTCHSDHDRVQDRDRGARRRSGALFGGCTKKGRAGRVPRRCSAWTRCRATWPTRPSSRSTVPREIKATYVTDADIADLAARAADLSHELVIRRRNNLRATQWVRGQRPRDKTGS